MIRAGGIGGVVNLFDAGEEMELPEEASAMTYWNDRRWNVWARG